jgi:hypothetical protein
VSVLLQVDQGISKAGRRADAHFRDGSRHGGGSVPGACGERCPISLSPVRLPMGASLPHGSQASAAVGAVMWSVRGHHRHCTRHHRPRRRRRRRHRRRSRPRRRRLPFRRGLFTQWKKRCENSQWIVGSRAARHPHRLRVVWAMSGTRSRNATASDPAPAHVAGCGSPPRRDASERVTRRTARDMTHV